MKKIVTILTACAAAIFATACNTAPVILPDTTGDSAMLLKIKSDIENGKQVTTGYAWILWYLPVLFLVIAWGWKEFVANKPKDCPQVTKSKKSVANKKKKKPTVESAPSTVQSNPPQA